MLPKRRCGTLWCLPGAATVCRESDRLILFAFRYVDNVASRYRAASSRRSGDSVGISFETRGPDQFLVVKHCFSKGRGCGSRCGEASPVTYGGLHDSAREERGSDSRLREAFEVTEFEETRMTTKGHTSSLVFRIVVRGSPFLLKIITRTDDPTRHYTCMKAVAEAGLAPHVWYTSIEDRISITDFVESAPFPAVDALVRIPTALRTLHALPPFPRVPNHYQHLMHVPNQQRGCRGRIHPKVSGGEHSAQRRKRGTLRPVRASGCGLPASRSGHGVESQRPVQAGQYPFRRTPRMAGGLGSCFPERSVCRPGGRCGCPNSGTFIGASGRARSTWRTTR